MDVREKLVEMLGRVQQMGVIYRENQMDERYPTIEQIRNTEVAARLIANGVTVQEWIPVTERLPEQADPATAVLGITKQGKCYVVYYYKAAINDELTGFYDNAVKREVTHWMPIPSTEGLE